MPKASRLVLIVAVLAVAGVATAEEEALVAVAPQADAAAAVEPDANAPLVTIEPAEGEAALVVDGEVDSLAMSCTLCPLSQGPQCSDGYPVGYPCGEPIYNCSCGYCFGGFYCLRP